jgi:hypothetical protein
MIFGGKFCIPGVKENAEQKTRPRAPLSEAKLELKRIVFCGSILFYKCTIIILFPEVSCIIKLPAMDGGPQQGGNPGELIVRTGTIPAEQDLHGCKSCVYINFRDFHFPRRKRCIKQVERTIQSSIIENHTPRAPNETGQPRAFSIPKIPVHLKT